MGNDRDQTVAGRRWSIQEEGAGGAPDRDAPKGAVRWRGTAMMTAAPVASTAWAQTQARDLALNKHRFHRCGQLLLLLDFLWKCTSNTVWLSPSSRGPGPNQGSLIDDRSRGSQVGWVRPRLRWVWQRPEGESSLQLSPCSSAASPSEPLEGLRMVEAAGREVRGQMWPQRPAVSRAPLQLCLKDLTPGAHERQVRVPEPHGPLSHCALMRRGSPPGAPAERWARPAERLRLSPG